MPFSPHPHQCLLLPDLSRFSGFWTCTSLIIGHGTRLAICQAALSSLTIFCWGFLAFAVDLKEYCLYFEHYHFVWCLMCRLFSSWVGSILFFIEKGLPSWESKQEHVHAGQGLQTYKLFLQHQTFWALLDKNVDRSRKSSLGHVMRLKHMVETKQCFQNVLDCGHKAAR